MDETHLPPSQKRRYRPARNYPHRFPVRVTDEERKGIQEAAAGAGLSVSRFLARTVIERRYPPTLREREEIFRLRFLLEKAGTNLNQVAHRLNAASRNAHVVPPTLAEIRVVARMIKAVATQIRRRF